MHFFGCVVIPNQTNQNEMKQKNSRTDRQPDRLASDVDSWVCMRHMNCTRITHAFFLFLPWLYSSHDRLKSTLPSWRRWIVVHWCSQLATIGCCWPPGEIMNKPVRFGSICEQSDGNLLIIDSYCCSTVLSWLTNFDAVWISLITFCCGIFDFESDSICVNLVGGKETKIANGEMRNSIFLASLLRN